ncbi:putative Ig domain-containing protein [Devosia limi]|uniref:putative Ig domain-containing protein n=1 Tax=Devosia limi TaxID=288995 RepID=UPI0011608456|nr:putative Ig domain-containing protein [Devosia limi]
MSGLFALFVVVFGGVQPALAAPDPVLSQMITFTNPGAQNFGTTPILSATSDSGLTPTFTSSTSNVCTITSGGALTFVSAGTCTINADQAGNGSYLPASQVSRSFMVNPVWPDAQTGVGAVRGDRQASVSFAAPASTGGIDIIGYTVTSSPGGLTATGSSSPLTVGGLTNGIAYTFTVTATNAAGTSSASAPSNSVTPEVGHVITLSPAGGALPDGMAQEVYAPKIAASGNVGALSFNVSAGALPQGLNVDGTGAFVGTIDAAAAGSYSFSITVTDTGGGSVTGNYTMNVVPRAVTAEDKAVVVPPGATPLPVNLSEGATGGPFDTGDVVNVSPPHAGTARIVGADVAQVGGPAPSALYLKFTPNPQFGGTAVVSYTLHSPTLGRSNIASVSFTTTINPVAVEDYFSTLSTGFVKSRAGLLAGAVDVPGLVNRRAMASASAPGSLSFSPSGNSISMNFAASTLAAAASAADSLAMQPVGNDGINFWIDGTATLHVRADNGTDHWGSFALLSAGGDVLVNDKLLVGLALHVDWMDDITDFSRANGTGVLVGPYMSAEIGEGVFLDASVFYGRSWNNVSTSLFGGAFETDRLLARAKLEGQWALSDALTFKPSANALYLQERAGSYTVVDGLGNGAVIDAFTTSQLRVSLGGTLQFSLAAGDGLTVQPFLGGQFGLSMIDGKAGSFGTLTTGFDLLGLGDWTLGTSAELGIDGAGMRSLSGKARLGLRF